MKLAPHDAELIEADARELWERMSTSYKRKPAWADLSEEAREHVRSIAANPYRRGAGTWR